MKKLFGISRLQAFFPVLILTLLIGCSSPATQPPQTPPTPASVSGDSSTPKIIPFFTTESDPDQLAVLQSLIVEYQNLNPGIEVDIVIASPASPRHEHGLCQQWTIPALRQRPALGLGSLWHARHCGHYASKRGKWK